MSVLVRSLAFLAGLTLAAADAASQPPELLTCDFNGGSRISVSAAGAVDGVSRSTEKAAYIFGGLTAGSGKGKYRNVAKGWEGETFVLRDDHKINIVEDAFSSDNNFVVTIVIDRPRDRGFAAVLSRNAFAPGLKEFDPVQLLGWCR